MWWFAPILAPSFLFASATAQSTNADCKNNSDTSWSWNSLGQSPCLMAAYIQGACQPDGQWMVQGLPDATFNYDGPSADTADVCTCSSVAYALSSACGFCQGSAWPEWSQWTRNCRSEDVHNGSFPHVIPAGTAIPDWAFIPINGFLDEFDAVGSERIGDKLESSGSVQPTATGNSPTSSGARNASVTGGTSPTTGNTPEAPSQTSNASSHGPNIGGIVGGVVGGLVGVAGIAGLSAYFCFFRGRRERQETMREQEEYDSSSDAAVIPPKALPSPYYDSASGGPDATAAKESPLVNNVDSLPFVAPEPSPVVAPEIPPMRLYDPEDPTTFPPTPAPLTMPVLPRTNIVLDTYPNVVPELTHEDEHTGVTRTGQARRRPIPEL